MHLQWSPGTGSRRDSSSALVRTSLAAVIPATFGSAGVRKTCRGGRTSSMLPVIRRLSALPFGSHVEGRCIYGCLLLLASWFVPFEVMATKIADGGSEVGTVTLSAVETIKMFHALGVSDGLMYVCLAC